MEVLQCDDVTIPGNGIAIFLSEVNHFPKHLPSGSSFLITGGPAGTVEIMINRKVGVVVLVVDISESDIIHRPQGKTAVKLKTLLRTNRLTITVGGTDKPKKPSAVTLSDVRQAVRWVISLPAVETSTG